MTRAGRFIPAIGLTTVLVLTTTWSSCNAQGQADHAETELTSESTSTKPGPLPISPPGSNVDPEKVVKVTALFAAVSGIAVFGIGAIAVTMLWARHLRRIARDPGPPQKTIGNDFWFLKPPKPSGPSPDATRQAPQEPPEPSSETEVAP